MLSTRVLAFADRGEVTRDSGYVALMALLRHPGGVLGVVTAHLTWDTPGTAPAARIGLRQARQLLVEIENDAAGARGWIVCGDFNVTPDDDVVALVEQAGLRHAHRDLAGVYSCNIGATARSIDYLFHSATLRAEPMESTRIDDQTILPSVAEPSDHVALRVRFDWRD